MIACSSVKGAAEPVTAPNAEIAGCPGASGADLDLVIAILIAASLGIGEFDVMKTAHSEVDTPHKGKLFVFVESRNVSFI